MTLARFRGRFFHRAARLSASTFLLLTLVCTSAFAASVRGIVTDATGARVSGATVVLLQNGEAVGSAVSGADGSYQITTGTQGRFFLLTNAKSFRQLETPVFYAKQLDTIERNIVLEPEWVRDSIVVTPTGTPTPQPQTSSATDVIGPLDIDLRTDLVSTLPLMPGTSVMQIGQRGSQSSLFVRGGDSDATMVLVDGVEAGDLGGRFDFGTLPATGVERAEVYRGTNSNLYGAGALSGVVNLTTPRGTTPFPSFFLRADGGNFNTHHEEATIAGAHGKLDYLGTYSWLQTSNALPNDQHHMGAAAGNLGYQLNAKTQIRGTAHYNVAATGIPNAWDFYGVADDGTQKDQDIYASGSIDHQTTDSFHNVVRYGLARKREQSALWNASGEYVLNYDGFGDNAYLGRQVTIRGANGASATGRAILDYDQAYPFQYHLVSNRDEAAYQGDYRFTPHLMGLIGFQFEDEHGAEIVPSYGTNETTEHQNYDYSAAVHGDFKGRFFYTLGGGLQHYSLFGVETTPRAGFTYYALRPRTGTFSGTRVMFNFGDAVREPALTDEFGSLYHFLVSNGFGSVAQQLHIGPLTAPRGRMYEGGLEQAFLSDRILFRARYFHNEFGKQIEYVGGHLLPNLIPGLTDADKQQLESALGFYYTNDYGLTVNTQAYCAQGFESTLEGGIGSTIFLRGGYTYLDAVVQRSFNSDNEALTDGFAPTWNGIPIGAISPLVGARPFRRPPHTGFFTGTYARHPFTGIVNMSFASRSDDSTYLWYQDSQGGNSLLLPNRNLDYGYAKIDVGGSYQMKSWIAFYGLMENLTSNQHMGPIGYPTLPFTVRSGVKLQWGRESK
ncbi:TonB-dependent receptor [Occallatibacter riparius]|uniref:TonB-dependent receptor n=1 Tax=Occallatibacter riparius TaxID=1002689 RepID=A0A9J7BGN2_9BACT|nr:TonB-dependent receptor [Occallatibacter riparius]UWZ81903.1 TonB-dependent receptor [Occallatibacter riparius]